MKIFISHSTQEKALADSLAEVIRDAFPSSNVQYSSDFSADGGIDLGDRWHPWILNQVRTSTVTLVVLSHQSASNEWLLWEAGAASGVALATGEKTTVIPCLYGLAPEKLPAPLSFRQSVRADTKEGILRILQTIARRNRRRLLHNVRMLLRFPSSPKGVAELSFLPSDTNLTKDRLEQNVNASQAFVKSIAWRETPRKLTRIFVLFPSLRYDPFYLDLLAGLTGGLPADFDLSLHLPSRAYSGAKYAEKLAAILKSQANYEGGVIAPTLSGTHRDRIKSLISEFKIPTAIVDINPFESDTLPDNTAYLGFDNTQGGEIAAKAMLHEIGGKRPCSILILASYDQPARHQAFIKALPDDVEKHVEFVTFSRSDARERVSRLLRHRRNGFDGIFGVSDEIAIGALEASSDRTELIVIGYDGIPAAKTLIDLKTGAFRNTIVQDPFTLGEEAITLLADMVRGRRKSCLTILPVDSYIR